MGGGGETTSFSHPEKQQVVEEEDGDLVSVESLLLFDHNNNSQQDSDESTSNNTQREYDQVFGEEFHGFNKWASFNSSESDFQHLRRLKVFQEIIKTYETSKLRVARLEEAKRKLLSYKPGAWTEEVGCLNMNDYDVPKTTTLILVGLSGSGKSSLVNRISRVFEDDMFTPERAQVSYNFVGDGTIFLHEYMIPRGSTSFCLYDTRGLNENAHDNFEMIKSWMGKGVRHGELVLRDGDSSSERNYMKCKARQAGCFKERRVVNFVIFVINALSVVRSMDGDNDTEYTDLLQECFSCPYLSCKDDKPVVVCTHGDLLSNVDRARVRVHLGELLGIPPAKQIFDIPDNCDPETDLAVVDMLTYSLIHADKSLPGKIRPNYKVLGIMMIALLCICFYAFWSSYPTFELKNWPANWHLWYNSKNSSESRTNFHAIPKSESTLGVIPHVDWHEIRHLW